MNEEDAEKCEKIMRHIEKALEIFDSLSPAGVNEVNRAFIEFQLSEEPLDKVISRMKETLNQDK